jgi:hypothetical protein
MITATVPYVVDTSDDMCLVKSCTSQGVVRASAADQLERRAL